MLLRSPVSVRISDYDYLLPESRIARFPLEKRSGSKLLVCDKGDISHTGFENIAGYAGGGQLMIFNNTRVIQARIFMYKPTGSKIEIFLLEPSNPPEYNLAFASTGRCRWKCMTGNKKRWKGGKLEKRLSINGTDASLFAETAVDHGDCQIIEFSWDPGEISFGSIIECAGLTPIPPYLNRLPEPIDKSSYQTVYSRYDGSVAAPTAGLHFTGELLDKIRNTGCVTDEITLHVGAGTFQPVKSETIENHPMHSEHFSVTAATIDKLIRYAGNITAVGTTSARTLESLYWFGVKLLRSGNGIRQVMELSQWEYYDLPRDIPIKRALEELALKMAEDGIDNLAAKTQLFIVPGYRFRAVNRLITNFHQPGSTLLLLIAAFIGDDWRRVYDYAMENDFRFLSYGDSSLLIP